MADTKKLLRDLAYQVPPDLLPIVQELAERVIELETGWDQCPFDCDHCRTDDDPCRGD